jgi:hypothetical protein
MLFQDPDPPMPSDDLTLRNTTHYQIFYKDVRLMRGRLTIPEDTIMNYMPLQWPWIFSHCISMGDISPEICSVRLTILNAVAWSYRSFPPLKQFVVKKPSNKVELTAESFDAWMKVMYPVTSLIGSRFHPPCNVLEERYGGLKLGRRGTCAHPAP